MDHAWKVGQSFGPANLRLCGRDLLRFARLRLVSGWVDSTVGSSLWWSVGAETQNATGTAQEPCQTELSPDLGPIDFVTVSWLYLLCNLISLHFSLGFVILEPHLLFDGRRFLAHLGSEILRHRPHQVAGASTLRGVHGACGAETSQDHGGGATQQDPGSSACGPLSKGILFGKTMWS